MNKKILQKIDNLAKFIFDESDYNKLFKFINNDQLNDARLLIDDKLEEIDLSIRISRFDDEELLSQYKQCDKLLDIVMGSMLNEEAYEEGKQFRKAVNS